MNAQKLIAVLESVKAGERRIPIHPDHFSLINRVGCQLAFQKGYASHFINGPIRNFLVRERAVLLKEADVIFLLKPRVEDLRQVKMGATVVGWCHAVQQQDVARVACERNLTLISMENMYESTGRHLFWENNFAAGELAVSHALEVVPHQYPINSRIVVISYGNVSQGAVAMLNTMDFSNISVFTRRDPVVVKNKLPMIRHFSFFDKLQQALFDADIIINGIKQDIAKPYCFLSLEELKRSREKFIIDISCDSGVGFEFSQCTSLERPVLSFGKHYYYAVDHTPTLNYRVVSLGLSRLLLPIMNAFIENNFPTKLYDILMQAVDVHKGIIVNQDIIRYQKLIESRVLAA